MKNIVVLISTLILMFAISCSKDNVENSPVVSESSSTNNSSENNVIDNNNHIDSNSSIIFVKVDGDSTNSGLSWNDAVNSPQKAFDIAKEKEIKEIWIAKGTYYIPHTSTTDTSFLFINEKQDTISIYGGFDGTESSLSQRDFNANKTILSADYNHDYIDKDGDGFIDSLIYFRNRDLRVVYMLGQIKLDGFGITGGYSDSYGGGVFNKNGVIINCKISGNSAFFGGGIYVDYGVILNCAITKNFAGQGGGVYNKFGTVNSCTINGNIADFGGKGGGVYNELGKLNNCIIDSNDATNGGGVFAESGEVNNSIIKGSSSDGITTSGYLNSCIVSGNKKGGVINKSGTITNCTIISNILLSPRSGIYDNYGGGVYNDKGIIFNCTISGNLAFGEGDGVYNHVGKIYNSIIWDNGEDELLVDDDYQTSNIVNCIVKGGLTQTEQIIDIIDQNPLFDGVVNTGEMAGCNLKDYTPEPVQTMSIQAGSPAIDAGFREYLYDQENGYAINAPFNDARGVSRPQGQGYDIGAYEVE